jgi:hypothetical protein
LSKALERVNEEYNPARSSLPVDPFKKSGEGKEVITGLFNLITYLKALLK